MVCLLLLQGGILQQGFTLHMLRQLDRQTAFMAKGVPKVLGGPRRVSSEMLLQMVQRLQVFVALAVDTVKAEFPGHDIVMAFNAFKGPHKSPDGKQREPPGKRQDKFGAHRQCSAFACPDAARPIPGHPANRSP